MGFGIDIDIVDINDNLENLPSKTYKIDFENSRIGGFIDSLDAIKQFSEKALNTRRFAFAIYNSLHGSEFELLIGNNEGTEYFETESIRMLKECLLVDDRITNVRDITFSYQEDEVTINYSLDTIYGALDGMEVSIDV